MPRRLRPSVLVTAALSLCAVVCRGESQLSVRRRLRSLAEVKDYTLDGKTTYCWGVNANVSASNVGENAIYMHGVGTACPLSITLSMPTKQVNVNDPIHVMWAATMNTASEGALFQVGTDSYLIDKSTRKRASIIHSNLHACRSGTGCDALTRGDGGIQPTQNQIGNITTEGTVFTSNELVFPTPGDYVVLAHIIVPGRTIDTRYDFSVFAPLTVHGVTDEGEQSAQLPSANTSRGSRELSKNQMIVLASVGGVVLVLLVMLGVMWLRKRMKRKSMSKQRHPSDPMSTKQTALSSVHDDDSNPRRSSNWTDLYAVDDALPSSIIMDDHNTIAILRASRVSTPSQSPSQARTVADFRHDVARWDMSSSASPITPSSSEILLAAMLERELAATPGSNCFVPLEDLVPISPPQVHSRTHNTRVYPSRHKTRHGPPDDSDDEHEGDI